jgi:AcrR family transcriptional regulator
MRSAESRRRILNAMLALVLEGQPDPSAEAVALRAGVGLRTVFRLFRDMESICAEMLAPQRLEFVACFSTPYAAAHGPARVRELYGRLATLYEARMPLRRAGMIRRYSSPSLAGGMRELDAAIANFIDHEMPGDDAAARERRIMLNLLMSYEAWMRLRDGQGLEAAPTLATLVHAIDRHLA